MAGVRARHPRVPLLLGLVVQELLEGRVGRVGGGGGVLAGDRVDDRLADDLAGLGHLHHHRPVIADAVLGALRDGLGLLPDT